MVKAVVCEDCSLFPFISSKDYLLSQKNEKK